METVHRTGLRAGKALGFTMARFLTAVATKKRPLALDFAVIMLFLQRAATTMLALASVTAGKLRSAFVIAERVGR